MPVSPPLACVSIDDDVAGGGGTEGRALGGPGSPGGILGIMAGPKRPLTRVYPRRRRRRWGCHPFPQHALRATEKPQDERFFQSSIIILPRPFLIRHGPYNASILDDDDGVGAGLGAGRSSRARARSTPMH